MKIQVASDYIMDTVKKEDAPTPAVGKPYQKHPMKFTKNPSQGSLCSKRPYFLYQRNNAAYIHKIIRIISVQSTIGIAAVFDAKSLAAGLTNMTHFIVTTDSPRMTYVFDCNSLDPIEVLQPLRHVLLNPNVIKVVHKVDGCLPYLYHKHYLELPNVIDLQIFDHILRGVQPDVSDGSLASLELLVRIYVDASVQWPKRSKDPENERAWGDDYNFDAAAAMADADAAMEGAFLLDIFRAQQQAKVGPYIMCLGPEARKKLAALPICK